MCVCWSSSTKNKSQEQNCSSLNPPVSIPRLLAGKSSGPGRRALSSLSSCGLQALLPRAILGANYPMQTFVPSRIVGGCYSCLRLGVHSIKWNNKSHVFTMDFFLHTDDRLSCCPQQQEVLFLLLFIEGLFRQSRCPWPFCSVHFIPRDLPNPQVSGTTAHLWNYELPLWILPQNGRLCIYALKIFTELADQQKIHARGHSWFFKDRSQVSSH